MEISRSCLAARQAANRQFPLQFLVDFARAVLDDKTRKFFEYCHLIQNPKYKKDWGLSFRNEVGLLAQGIPGRNTGTNTSVFIDKSKVAANRWKDIVYSQLVYNMQSEKEVVNRKRLMYRGSNICINIDSGTLTEKKNPTGQVIS